MKLSDILEKAELTHRIKDGLVLCENCDNPASLACSTSLDWIACAPCVFGEADSLDPDDFISQLAPASTTERKSS